MKTQALILVAALLPIGVANAVGDEELKTCASIEDLSSRLTCYDGLAKRGNVTDVPTSTPVEAAAPASADTPPPHTTHSGTPEEDRFGAEALGRLSDAPIKSKRPEVYVIQSRIVGQFTGWERGTEFTLENGQVWKKVDFGSVRHVAENPAVMIERGAWGSYWMQIEGLDGRTSVRRVK